MSRLIRQTGITECVDVLPEVAVHRRRPRHRIASMEEGPPAPSAGGGRRGGRGQAGAQCVDDLEDAHERRQDRARLTPLVH